MSNIKSLIKAPFIKIKDFNNKNYCDKLKQQLNNKDFSIICDNCVGGIIYHNLGMKFLSPTVNTYIPAEDFLHFINNLKYYSICDMIDASSDEFDYPIGEIVSKDTNIPNIKVHFMHADSFEKGKEEFFRRYQRINYDNMYYMMEYYKDQCNIDVIKKFDSMDFKKICILHEDVPDIKNKVVFDIYKDGVELPKGKLFWAKNKLTRKRFLDSWDYVSFLNSWENLLQFV